MKKDGFKAATAVSAVLLLLCCSAGQGLDASLLRIDAPGGWTEQLDAAPGSTIYLVVLPGKEGNATFCHQYPDGRMENSSYFLLGYDRLPVYVEAAGRHVLSYTIGGRESNSVIVDVKAGCVAACRAALPAPPCIAAGPSMQESPVALSSRAMPVSLSDRLCYDPVTIQYYPIGSHIMNYRNGIGAPKATSQYHFGRDFSLGTIDGNYPGTPFILQYLSDP